MCTSAKTISLGFTNEMFPQGVHMCYFYNSEEERRVVIPKFVASALQAGESISYFARYLPAAGLLASLESPGLDISAEQSKGHFRLTSTEQTYHPDGSFDPDKMIARLHALYADSMAKGHSGARVSGEMHWALKAMPGADRLIEYEAKLNGALMQSPITAICQYNTSLFDGATIMEVLRVHPLVITNGQVMHNPFFSLPDGMD